MQEQQSMQTITSESSRRLVSFLEETGLHKKDFAEMIGVTLSYVYSLIDENVAFSTRITTLERIAVIMDIDPEEFPEYRPSEEPKLIDQGIQFLKEKQNEAGLTNVQFIKRFPRSKRVDIVDLWRGAKPLPLDWTYLENISSILGVSKKDIYPYWQAQMQQYLMCGGIDMISNTGLFNAMFEGVKSYLKI